MNMCYKAMTSRASLMSIPNYSERLGSGMVEECHACGLAVALDKLLS